jgi:hypothetical protein
MNSRRYGIPKLCQGTLSCIPLSLYTNCVCCWTESTTGGLEVHVLYNYLGKLVIFSSAQILGSDMMSNLIHRPGRKP